MESSSKLSLSVKQIVLITIIIVLFGTALFAYQYYKELGLPVDSNSDKSIAVEIPRGASTSNIARILKENELIKNELYFKLVTRQNNIDGSFQAGEYELKQSMDVQEIINKIINGETFVDTIKFTIPEGFELRQIVDRISTIDGIDIDKTKLINIIEDEDFDFRFLENIPKGENRLEGFLFPDTYRVERDIDEKEIIFTMLNRFNQVFKDEYYDKAEELNMSLLDVISLASIIEREAMVESERPIISGVFQNRLEKGMLLQSCATVQYVLGERKEVLSYKDLEIESPFNTYKNVGLPPRPIASPGQASIEAALYPVETDFLYFVAKGDGSHIFSKTYSEHLRAQNEN